MYSSLLKTILHHFFFFFTFFWRLNSVNCHHKHLQQSMWKNILNSKVWWSYKGNFSSLCLINIEAFLGTTECWNRKLSGDLPLGPCHATSTKTVCPQKVLVTALLFLTVVEILTSVLKFAFLPYYRGIISFRLYMWQTSTSKSFIKSMYFVEKQSKLNLKKKKFWNRGVSEVGDMEVEPRENV